MPHGLKIVLLIVLATTLVASFGVASYCGTSARWRFVLYYLALALVSPILLLLEGVGLQPASVLHDVGFGLVVPVAVSVLLVPFGSLVGSFLAEHPWRFLGTVTLHATWVFLAAVTGWNVANRQYDLLWQQALGGLLAVLVAWLGRRGINREDAISV